MALGGGNLVLADGRCYQGEYRERIMLSREEARAIYRAGEETVIEVLCSLSAKLELAMQRISWLEAKVLEQEAKIRELESRLKLNSQNSSRPPSSDGLNRPNNQSLREKSGRKPGGQFGHPGHTLQMSAKPDRIEKHEIKCCAKCGQSLVNQPLVGMEKRQVFDVPQPRLEVTEHQAEKKICPHCGQTNRAEFPVHVTAPVQYGANIKAQLVYLNIQQLLPYDRISEMTTEMCGCHISPATVVEVVKEAAALATPVVEQIRQGLQNSPVVHYDETGCRINGKTAWLHSASTKDRTLYHTHEKRGSEGTNAGGILPAFQGIAVHDCWKPYFKYECQHAVCNAHLLRELKAIHEDDHQAWAKDMTDFLLAAKKQVETSLIGCLVGLAKTETEVQYQRIIAAGYEQNPRPLVKETPKRGRIKNTKAVNILNRLRDYQPQVLAFIANPLVPFDNNQAERDIRMVKLQQKISGCFRTFRGASYFCTLRSYVSTLRKNCQQVLAAISALFTGQVVLPLKALSP